MRRRVLGAIVGVTVVALAVLNVPLAILIAYRDVADARDNLGLVADRTATKITSRGPFGDGPIELLDIDPSLEVGVYLPSGERIAGTGPDRADSVTAEVELLTLGGRVDNIHIVARPIVEREQQVAVVRVAEPLSRSLRHVPRDLAILFAFDLSAVLIAAAVGAFVSSRLVRPLLAIRNDARRLGEGDFAIRPQRSGIEELDQTADALAETATRLHRTMERERSFSADASHQLRTPITSLRLAVEGELANPTADPSAVLRDALADIDRLESIIGTLLDIARSRPVHREELDAHAWGATLSDRWGQALASERPQRSITVAVDSAGTVRVSHAVLDQVLDILLSNAVLHGEGDVAVEVVTAVGTLVVTVADEGRLRRDADDLFVRLHPGAAGHGLGLALARSLAEAEGGRLVIASVDPTSFRLILPDVGDVDPTDSAEPTDSADSPR